MKLFIFVLLLFQNNLALFRKAPAPLKQTISDQRQSATSKNKPARHFLPNCDIRGSGDGRAVGTGFAFEIPRRSITRPGAPFNQQHTNTEEDEKHGDDQPENWQGCARSCSPGTGRRIAHGDVTPQAVDVSTLKPVGDDWFATNPYRGNAEAIRIGSSAYNQNCARCHGPKRSFGGIAPDLRYLPVEDEDEIFLNRIRHGSTRGGRVYMPPFEGILQQEAMWQSAPTGDRA